jgi:hypothetical protein
MERQNLKIQELEHDKSKLEQQIPKLVQEAADRIKQELKNEGFKSLNAHF